MLRFSLIAMLAAAGCATAPASAPAPAPPPAQAFDPYYADGARRALVAARETVLHETPRIDARRLRRLPQGHVLTARYSVYNEEWKQVEFDDGEVVFVFGNPFFPAAEDAAGR